MFHLSVDKPLLPAYPFSINTIISRINTLKIIPVIVVSKPEEILPLVEVLVANGLPAAEITFRSKAAEGAIRLLKREFPQVLTGAGTLLTIDQIDRALDAGSDFLVSPGFNPPNVEYALKKGALMIPGTTNPSLVEQAMSLGLRTLKFFPAEASGGIPMLKAMNAVYPEVSFMPTGGISPENIKEYLALPNVTACGGSWMVKKDLITEKKWNEIGRITADAVRLKGEVL